MGGSSSTTSKRLPLTFITAAFRNVFKRVRFPSERGGAGGEAPCRGVRGCPPISSSLLCLPSQKASYERMSVDDSSVVDAITCDPTRGKVKTKHKPSPSVAASTPVCP